MEGNTRGPAKNRAVDDLRVAKIEETRQRSRVLRLQGDREEGKLCDLGEVKDFFGRVLGAWKSQVWEMAPNLGARANPADPVLATTVIQDGHRTLLQSISEQIAGFIPSKRSPKTGTRPGEMVSAR